MKTSTKVLIGGGIAVVLVVVLAIAAIGGGVAYVIHRFDNPESAAALKKAKADGNEFGKTVDQEMCMQKGFTLPEPVDSFDLGGEEFVQACLKSSQNTPNFCDGVPFVLDRNWFEEQCRTNPGSRASCMSAFIAKRNVCRMGD
ncbi:MAG: hypothetical protein ABJA02_16060 [Acidobacteriota bacterium]